MTEGPARGQRPTGPAARAADPNTPQVQLQMLADDHPELRPQIAENPSAYPELLQWLAELGDPAVDAGLARRAAEADEFSAVRGDRPRNHDQSYDQGHAQSHDPGHARPSARSGYYPAAPTGPPPWEPRVTTAVYADDESEPRRGAGGTCAIIFLILLVAAAAVVAAYFLIFNVGFPGDGDPAEERATQDAEAEAVRPAPEGAQDIPAFTAPSGNINCVIGEDELACSILDYTFDVPQDCAGPARLSVGTQDPQLDCGSTEGVNSATLQYGRSASNGPFACTSSEAAFECWNTETGNGFTLSRESYQLQN